MEFQKFASRVQSTFDLRNTEGKVVEGLAFIRDTTNDLAKRVDINHKDFSAVGRGPVSSIRVKSKTIEFRTPDYTKITVLFSDTNQDLHQKEIDFLYLPNDKEQLMSQHFQVPLNEKLMEKYLNRFEDDLIR